MSHIISSHDEWLVEYRKDKYRIWIKIDLSNGEEKYFCDYKDWDVLKNYCVNKKLNIEKIGLQYRSNYLGVDTKDCDGVYLVKSIIGMMGETSRQTYTIGKISGDKVYKQVFLTPELIENRVETDPVSNCFDKGLFYHLEHDKRKTQTLQ